MKNSNVLEKIRLLSAFGERQLAGEHAARNLLCDWLHAAAVPYRVQSFMTAVPKILQASLVADGKTIPAAGTSFVSGTITDSSTLISSLTSSQKFLYEQNINFNPRCKVISRSNHYFAPSLAVAPAALSAICRASTIQGIVRVKKIKHCSANILVGNTKNPQTILFCHYDSIGPGAVDNASGTALLLQMIIETPKYLKENLFVFAGNEELSYDQPVYWGRGYRVFERRYYSLLQRAKNILIIDCLGQTAARQYRDPAIVRLGFPVMHQHRWTKKIAMIAGDLGALMRVYHSSADTANIIQPGHMHQARVLTERLLIRR